ncbi:MAG: tRNA (adenosine(37)-N6)-threonylcarbamoyltransferase complex ATPase subunit type 1 TsaE [Lachnospiraceae bacterium]|nr:tRNA (adenosine(37)-N6)-threonylcarbamoyltransferase complex ATPase subunit type 1 TsaE [Lachnospiraceae bacterium]
MEERHSHSAEESFAFGKELGNAAKAGAVYCLRGELGAGKTVLAQGFAAGLGITEAVNSPTFTILQVYEGGRLPLYHFDLYRIEDAEELYEVGLDDYLFGGGVCLIEWPECIEEELPSGCIYINIEKDAADPEYRRIRMEER